MTLPYCLRSIACLAPYVAPPPTQILMTRNQHVLLIRTAQVFMTFFVTMRTVFFFAHNQILMTQVSDHASTKNQVKLQMFGTDRHLINLRSRLLNFHIFFR